MNGLKAVLLCVAGALVCAVLKQQKPEFRMAAALAVGLVAVGLSLDGLRSGVDLLRQLASDAGMGSDSLSLLVRATGIALIADFGAQLCRDAEESALAGRVELAGRVALLGLSMPLLSGLTGQLMSLLP